MINGKINYNDVDDSYVDKGNDYNMDKHCDLDGWFVDNDGNHKPVIHRMNDDEAKLYNQKFTDSSIKRKFNMSGKFSEYELNPFYIYSKNEECCDLSSPKINRVLRFNENSNNSINKRIRELDYLISCSKTNRKISVFRGIPLAYDKYSYGLFFLKPNDVITDKGFVSTTIKESHALTFALKNIEQNIGVLLIEIDLPNGFNCFPLLESEKSAFNSGEFEILLKRNAKFKHKETLVTDLVKNGELKYVAYMKWEALL